MLARPSRSGESAALSLERLLDDDAGADRSRCAPTRKVRSAMTVQDCAAMLAEGLGAGTLLRSRCIRLPRLPASPIRIVDAVSGNHRGHAARDRRQ